MDNRLSKRHANSDDQGLHKVCGLPKYLPSMFAKPWKAINPK